MSDVFSVAGRSISAEQIGVLLGLSLFYGFAFEGFYSEQTVNRPGGVRTFPLLALAGATLYAVEPRFALAFIAGLIALGTWVLAYIRANLESGSHPDGPLIIPAATLLAYVLGAITLTQPLWVAVLVVVVAVLLLGSRGTLHKIAQQVPQQEFLTAGQFLLLVGVVLPLLYNLPQIDSTGITPFKVWLAVVAVSTLSYASYLIQRYVFPRRGVLLTAILGGLYSSTATTVVLARKASEEGVTPDIMSGIVAATAMMYVRIVIVCAIFSLPLARALVAPMLSLAVFATVVAYVIDRRGSSGPRNDIPMENPLQLSTALIFAILLVVISLVSTWVQAHLGRNGIFALAAVVGVTDIDPFVLSLAQGGVSNVGVAIAAIAILIASSSNNILKAVYALAFSHRREGWRPATALIVMSVLGLIAASLMPR